MSMKPILFCTDMVKAILEGRKTQTRRVITPQPNWTEVISNEEALSRALSGVDPYGFRINMPAVEEATEKSKYKVGDILWVRETFAPWNSLAWDMQQYFERNDKKSPYIFRADVDLFKQAKGWRPSIFMPKEAARIFLKVTGVRCERVRDISDADCMAEGLTEADFILFNIRDSLLSSTPNDIRAKFYDFAQITGPWQHAYWRLWDKINYDRGYGFLEVNPWVWVYEFEMVEKPEGWAFRDD